MSPHPHEKCFSSSRMNKQRSLFLFWLLQFFGYCTIAYDFSINVWSSFLLLADLHFYSEQTYALNSIAEQDEKFFSWSGAHFSLLAFNVSILWRHHNCLAFFSTIELARSGRYKPLKHLSVSKYVCVKCNRGQGIYNLYCRWKFFIILM